MFEYYDKSKMLIPIKIWTKSIVGCILQWILLLKTELLCLKK